MLFLFIIQKDNNIIAVSTCGSTVSVRQVYTGTKLRMRQFLNVLMRVAANALKFTYSRPFYFVRKMTSIFRMS